MTQDNIKQLLALSKMHSEGQLTDEEFETLKKELMQGEAQPSVPKVAVTNNADNSVETNNADNDSEKAPWMDNFDVFLKYAISAALMAAMCVGANCLFYNHQYKKDYVDAASIPVGDASSLFGENADDNTDYDTQMSADPDTDESTWSTVVPNDCKSCNGTGKCTMCHGNGYSLSPDYPCIVCGGNGKCESCGGGTTKKQYKDIAIGSKNWRYSKFDKRREAEKAMMRLAYKWSEGKSADPTCKFTYTPITDGFTEEFTFSKTLLGKPFVKKTCTYSIYKCPSCHGKKCDKCYNGYVYKNTFVFYCGNQKLQDAAYENGKQVSLNNYSSGNVNSGSSSAVSIPSDGGSSSSSRYPRPCTNCQQTGNVIYPATYPGDFDAIWFCSTCRKNLTGWDYHHHKRCTVCNGDGMIDEKD